MRDRESDRERIRTLLRAAHERPPEDRDRWLDEACGTDRALRARLTELLQATREDTEHFDSRGLPNDGNERKVEGDASDDRSEPRLSPGQQLGRYEILDLLGVGGMGRVYRALDPSLGREVAIKALAHAFRGDSGFLRRFEREARVLAALSHPNIAAIYGFERLDGSPYLVLERVEGETLAQRLGRGPMPLQEALAIAVQIVEGLEEAHGKGVIHRDLKPSNVMLARGGRAKLVDFGLAKTASRRAADRENSAEPITEAGTVLGTARYMSPEQVQGDEVDTRTDVWAFGCLLYEMLTGRATFEGRSVPAVLAAVLRDEPDWQALPDEVPPAVRRLLRRCLRRDTRTRLQHIGDARIELVEAEGEPAAPSPNRIASTPARLVMPWAVAAGAIAIAAAVLVYQSRSRVATPRPARLSLEMPARVALATSYTAPFAVAPAGSPLVIEASEGETRRLYVRGLGETTLFPLLGTEGARQPFFSADGAWIAFFADRKLAKVPVGGGPVLPLADIGGNPRGAAWAADGTIVVAPSQTSGLVRISERGGRPVALTTLDRGRGEYSHRWPDVLPGGKWVLFTVGREDASFDEARVEAVSLATGERRPVVADASFARFLPPGQLLFVRGGRLLAVAFDPERLTVSGSPEVVVDGVRYDPQNGASHLAVSASGVLVYGPGVPSSAERYLAWIGRDGRLQRVADTPRLFRDPRVSPDGRQLAVVVGTSTESDLWLVDANATFSRLSFGVSPHRPVWASNGTRITVGAEKAGTWQLRSVAADGSGNTTALFEGPHRLYPNAWSPDGRYLVFQENRPDTGWDLRVLQVDGLGRQVGALIDLTSTPFHESNAVISPDGQWVAYESDELDGIVQIYVRSFPAGAHKVLASTGGARCPVWGPRGELYYWQTGERRLHVAYTRHEGDRLVVSRVEPVWSDAHAPAALARIVITVSGSRYDAHPSGSRFLVLETAAPALDPTLSRPVVVLDRLDGSSTGRRPPS